MVKTRNLKRALQNEALMHHHEHPQTNEGSIPRMARTRNPRRLNRLSEVNHQDEVPMHQQESLQSDEWSSEPIIKNKTRGCSFCLNIWGLPPGVKLPIQVNKLGQPIDDNSSKFSTFLGDSARKGTYCPIDILDWRKVPKSKKIEMLEIVQSKFLGIHGMDEWILQSIGHKWRNWKKHLKLKYFELEKPFEYLLKNNDERVIEEQWKGLITFWLSEEGKVNCFVALLSIMDRNKVIAKGFLRSMEPNNQVGGQVLAKNYCEVHVNVAVKRDEDLIRPYDWLQTVGDSFGVSIAWPISLVVRAED